MVADIVKLTGLPETLRKLQVGRFTVLLVDEKTTALVWAYSHQPGR